VGWLVLDKATAKRHSEILKGSWRSLSCLIWDKSAPPGSDQSNDASRRFASASPAIYRWVVARLEWPASSCTSRKLPPQWMIFQAAWVMNVRHRGAKGDSH
jgi:hypothetical protein